MNCQTCGRQIAVHLCRFPLGGHPAQLLGLVVEEALLFGV